MKKWYSFKALADNSVELYIFEEIGLYGVSAQDFVSELSEHKGKDITVHINSPGGDVFDGQAIYTALKNHTGKVTTKIEGLAASMATIISLAGDSVEMSENSLFMIHTPLTNAFGNKEELRKQISILNKLEDTMVSIYSSKSTLEEIDIRAYMTDETWFSAAEAKEAGFIDVITDEIKVAASYDITAFKGMTATDIQKTFKGGLTNENNKDMTDENKNWFVAQLDKLSSKIDKFIGNSEVEDVPTPVVDQAPEAPEVPTDSDNLRAQIAILETANEGLTNQLSETKEQSTEDTSVLEGRLTGMEAEISRLKAVPTGGLGSDPSLNTQPNADKDGWDIFADNLRK
tara:strand:+ start:1596 stop:2627 length:1032 start_codon:yes stop_codon:yes gene_type:complete